MLEIARIDLLHRHDNKHIGRAELPVDDSAIADESAKPEISLDQRRHRLHGGLVIKRAFRNNTHLNMKGIVRAATPFGRRQRMMMQEAQRHCVRIRIGAFEAGAADHYIDAVLADISPKAVPEKLDGALVAI